MDRLVLVLAVALTLELAVLELGEAVVHVRGIHTLGIDQLAAIVWLNLLIAHVQLRKRPTCVFNRLEVSVSGNARNTW